LTNKKLTKYDKVTCFTFVKYFILKKFILAAKANENLVKLKCTFNLSSFHFLPRPQALLWCPWCSSTTIVHRKTKNFDLFREINSYVRLVSLL